MLRGTLLLTTIFQLTIPVVAIASSRKVPWLYEPRTMIAGEVEYEQWITWKTNKASDSDYNEFRFRHEIEWGVTDTFQLAFYVADWRFKQTAAEEHTYFRDVAIEAIYQLQAPNPEQLGSAIYGEIKYGSDFVELEAKLLLEMDLEHVNLLYNFTIESEWEAIAKANNATVFAAYEICEYLGEQGHEGCEPGNPGGRVESAFGSVSFTQAFHSSSFNGRYMGMPCGLVIEFGDVVIYHAGDTSIFLDMELIGQVYQPDIAMLPIGDRFTMGPEMAAAAAEMIGASTAIPMHYNTWPPIEVDVARFAPKDIEVLVMEPGDSVEISA